MFDFLIEDSEFQFIGPVFFSWSRIAKMIVTVYCAAFGFNKYFQLCVDV
jgi:hypothetical protein